MNRAQRRQLQRGMGSARVVAMPTPNHKPRTRKLNDALKKACNMVTIDAGKMTDSQFVVKLMQEHFVKTGNAPVVLDPSAPMLIARHKISGEPLGMCSVKSIPPGKIYVENFLTVQGRYGKMAARAIAERLMLMAPRKVCVVEAGNDTMLRVLEHYGGRVVGFLVEGPYTETIGAPEGPVAAEPVESIV